MKEVFLSIIVPVYKVEKYLDRCVQSIVKQDLTECEIILVDDGSPDNCGKLCDEYAKCNRNIVSIHKKNGGLSDARNVGMDKSIGKYIWFIDSDDYIAEGSISEIISLLKKNPCDVLVCQSKTVDDNKIVQDERRYTIPTGEYTSEAYMMALKKHPESALFCAQFHICNRNFIESNKFRFCENILHEDELWTPQLLLKARSIYYSNLNVYFHYMRDGSIMHSSNMEKSGKSDLFITETLRKIFDKSGRNDLQYLRDHMADTYLQAVWKVPDFFELTKWDRITPLRNSHYFKTCVKSLLYFLSPKLYLVLHNLLKK